MLKLTLGVISEVFFLKIWRILCLFSPKKKTPLCTLCKGIFILFFLGCHCVKFHQEKCTNWETYCQIFFKKKFRVFIPRLV
jgi:hypothetical protein